MTPEERGSRDRHPAGQRRAPLNGHPLPRVIHSDSHSWEQPASPEPAAPAGDVVDHLLAAVFVIVAAAGVLAAVWLDWRWLVTAAVVDFAVALLGGIRLRRADR